MNSGIYQSICNFCIAQKCWQARPQYRSGDACEISERYKIIVPGHAVSRFHEISDGFLKRAIGSMYMPGLIRKYDGSLSWQKQIGYISPAATTGIVILVTCLWPLQRISRYAIRSFRQRTPDLAMSFSDFRMVRGNVCSGGQKRNDWHCPDYRIFGLFWKTRNRPNNIQNHVRPPLFNWHRLWQWAVVPSLLMTHGTCGTSWTSEEQRRQLAPYLLIFDDNTQE